MATTTITRSPSPARRSRGRSHNVAPRPTRDPFILAAGLLGLLVSAYLAVVDLSGGTTLCLAGSACDAVRASSYGQVAGLPVAALGSAYFVAVLLVALARARWQPVVLQVLGGAGLGAALDPLGLRNADSVHAAAVRPSVMQR